MTSTLPRPLPQPAWLQQRADLHAVAQELRPVYDDAELLAWLAQPNPWLGECAPRALLPQRLDEVLQAARADRFIASVG